MKKMKQKSKFFVCFSLPVIMLILTLGANVLYYLVRKDASEPEPIILIIALIMFVILPWLIFLYSTKLFWAVVEINSKGISRSLFKRFFKRNLLWEELYEIRVIYIPSGGAWLFFSNKSLRGMGIGKARTRKGQIQVQLTDKILAVVKKYYFKQIINLPE